MDATADAPLIAEHPEVPARARAAGLRGRARLQPTGPRRTAALLERLMGAGARRATACGSCAGTQRGGWIALDPAPGERGRAERRHRAPRGVGDDRGRAARVARAARRGRRAEQRAHRPPLLPLDLLPRAGRRAVRARRPRSPASRSTARWRSSGSRIILPPWLEPQRAEVEARLTPLPDPRAGLGARDPR